MKRLWIGVSLLAAVLVLSLLVAGFMERPHRAAARDLRQAADLAAEENWTGAGDLFHRAQAIWESRRGLTASLADHEPMEEAEGLFLQLDYYHRQKTATEFGAACLELASKLEAIANVHRFSLANFL